MMDYGQAESGRGSLAGKVRGREEEPLPVLTANLCYLLVGGRYIDAQEGGGEERQEMKNGG